MAQVTEIRIVCDECLRLDGTQTEGTEHNVGKQKVAVCDEHYTNVLEPALTLLDSLGGGKSRRAPAKPSEPAQDVACEECGADFLGTDYKRPKQALVMHKRNHHAAA